MGRTDRKDQPFGKECTGKSPFPLRDDSRGRTGLTLKSFISTEETLFVLVGTE